VTSWDTCDADSNDQYGRDFVLKQPSKVGPWVALGLGATLIAFLGYLIYANLLLQPPPSPLAPETTLRPRSALPSPTSDLGRALRHTPEWRQPAFTAVPQGRAPNALFGGQGPALLPEPALAPDIPSPAHVSTQASARH